MKLKVVHIDRKSIAFEAEARAFAENVLIPKWEAQARRRAEKLRAELRGTPLPVQRS